MSLSSEVLEAIDKYNARLDAIDLLRNAANDALEPFIRDIVYGTDNDLASELEDKLRPSYWQFETRIVLRRRKALAS